MFHKARCYDGANKMEVIVSPHSVKKLPRSNEIGQNGFENGWFEIVLHKPPGFVHSYKGSSLRRTQFSIKIFMAMIQKAMGGTIGKVVTKLIVLNESIVSGKKKNYVLVCRVQNLNDSTNNVCYN